MRISDWSSDVCSSDLAKSVDASGKFVMPGLWDMHVHFGGGPELIGENKALLPVYVAYGITSVRDAAADLGEGSEERRVGKECVVRVDLGGRRIFKKKNKTLTFKGNKIH